MLTNVEHAEHFQEFEPAACADAARVNRTLAEMNTAWSAANGRITNDYGLPDLLPVQVGRRRGMCGRVRRSQDHDRGVLGINISDGLGGRPMSVGAGRGGVGVSRRRVVTNWSHRAGRAAERPEAALCSF